ncbi:MAG: NAD-dependent epimerase/dehydratase family protein [Phycisphaerales bacterium]|nr:NAD-dependent epimerase/dehydratase family protein [Phycisphaerae bacterium]NNF41806.1 NAD-dependent epimerase/dehydratase family protein [Phycisphaerales bacterium]NNM24988.1 NAD-dependent epimerase/dehydratase family protein [Phycisphaerales bacterium]
MSDADSAGRAYDAYGGRLRGTRVCVTGGAGFIGSHLCDRLLALDADVTVIDDLSAGRRENLAAGASRVRFVEGSILDDAALDDAVGGAEIVFHLAAIASVPRSLDEPVPYFQINAMGTLAVLEAARRAGTRRVVYSASSSAYGDQPGMPRVETMPPDTRSPYAAAKVAGEHLLRAYAHCYDCDTVSLRYFNIFGPRQPADSAYAAVVPVFTSTLRQGGAVRIFGDGTQTRDFTPVANAVHANLLAATAERPLAGAVVNVACGVSISVLDLAGRIAALLGVPLRCEHAPPRRGEVQNSLADLSRAHELLGYTPLVPLEEGLRDTVATLAAGQDRT